MVFRNYKTKWGYTHRCPDDIQKFSNTFSGVSDSHQGEVCHSQSKTWMLRLDKLTKKSRINTYEKMSLAINYFRSI